MKLIPLSQNKFAQVDDADYDWLNKWKWCAHRQYKTFYAVRREGKKLIKMHRLILGLTNPTILVDHKDHDGLNNQRENIRKATPSQNVINKSPWGKSKYLGVNFHNLGNKNWRVKIKINGRSKHIGLYDNEIEAALAYNLAAIEYHGEFANINHIYG